MTNVRRPIHLHIRPLSVSNISRPRPCSPGTPMTPAAPNPPASNSCPPSRPNKDSLPSQILPHLFVGEQAQTNCETVNKLNIKYILSLGLLPLITTANSSKNSSNNSSRNQSPSSSQASSPQDQQTNNCDSKLATSPSCSSCPSSSSLSPPLSPAQILECQSLNLDDQLLPSRNSSKDFQICLDQDHAELVGPEISLEPTVDACTSLDAEDLDSRHDDKSGAVQDEHHDEYLTARQTEQVPEKRAGGCKFFSRERRVKGETKAAKLVRQIRCKCINIADNSEQMLAKFFDEAHQFIDEARRKKCNILVHCLAGISRSPTFAIAYLMRVNSLRLEDAYRMVKQRRPQIDPNLNSIGQLMVYEKSLDERER